jgi:hypothetical protein
VDLDEIAAWIVQHRGRRIACLRGLLRESHAEGSPALDLGVNVVDAKTRNGNAVVHEGGLERVNGHGRREPMRKLANQNRVRSSPTRIYIGSSLSVHPFVANLARE